MSFRGISMIVDTGELESHIFALKLINKEVKLVKKEGLICVALQLIYSSFGFYI